MAKRYPFIIASDDGATPAQLNLVKDKIPGNSSTPTYGDFKVYKDSVFQADIYVTSNLDGIYYFEYTESGIYEIRIGSSSAGHTAQDELKNIYLIGDDALSKSDVVDDLVSTDTDKPLSANQGKELEDNKASDTPGDGLAVNASHELSIYVDDETVEIDPVTGQLQVVEAAIQRANLIYSVASLAGSTDGDTNADYGIWRTTDSGFEGKFFSKFIKGSGDKFLHFSVETYEDGHAGLVTGQFFMEASYAGGSANAYSSTLGNEGVRETISVDISSVALYEEITVYVSMKRASGAFAFATWTDVVLFTTPFAI